MRIYLIAAVALAAASPAFAQDPGRSNATILKPINTFIDEGNRGDEKAASAAFTASPSIIDEISPYHWRGKNAFHAWFTAFLADMQKHGQTEPAMKLGKPREVMVSGASAYVVVPGHYTYKEGATPKAEDGMYAIDLKKGDAGWRIDAFAWAGSPPK